MVKRIALVCVVGTLMASPMAWAQEDQDVGAADEAPMSSEEEAPEKAPEVAIEAPATAANETPTEAAAPTEAAKPTEAAAPAKAAEPAAGSFNLNDGNQPGDGPPVTLDDVVPPKGSQSTGD